MRIFFFWPDKFPFHWDWYWVVVEDKRTHSEWDFHFGSCRLCETDSGDTTHIPSEFQCSWWHWASDAACWPTCDTLSYPWPPNPETVGDCFSGRRLWRNSGLHAESEISWKMRFSSPHRWKCQWRIRFGLRRCRRCQ